MTDSGDFRFPCRFENYTQVGLFKIQFPFRFKKLYFAKTRFSSKFGAQNQFSYGFASMSSLPSQPNIEWHNIQIHFRLKRRVMYQILIWQKIQSCCSWTAGPFWSSRDWEYLLLLENTLFHRIGAASSTPLFTLGLDSTLMARSDGLLRAHRPSSDTFLRLCQCSFGRVGKHSSPVISRIYRTTVHRTGPWYKLSGRPKIVTWNTFEAGRRGAV